jgi:cytochrome c peroxidase
MHDGSLATLEQVIDHYAAGGRVIADGPRAGDGRASPLKDPLITGFALSPDERAALVAFLRALTDESFVERARRRVPK